jgi:tRNA (adenine22-N1)-methyltransferase
LTHARGAGFALSARLAAVAELVPAGAPCADIGTDHGALAAWLAASGRVPLAWAIDLREGPLVGARRRVAALGLGDWVPIRRAAGCEGLDSEVRTVVLAGMGGPLMTRILAGAPDTVTRVVLQPNVGESPLRRWLTESGWAIDAERVVFDRDRPFAMLAAARVSRPLPLGDASDLAFGEASLHRDRPAFAERLARERAHLDALVDASPGAADALAERYAAIDTARARLAALALIAQASELEWWRTGDAT